MRSRKIPFSVPAPDVIPEYKACLPNRAESPVRNLLFPDERNSPELLPQIQARPARAAPEISPTADYVSFTPPKRCPAQIKLSKPPHPSTPHPPVGMRSRKIPMAHPHRNSSGSSTRTHRVPDTTRQERGNRQPLGRREALDFNLFLPRRHSQNALKGRSRTVLPFSK